MLTSPSALENVANEPSRPVRLPKDIPASLPKVILIGGAPFSGKTTIAREIARLDGRDLIHTDDLSAAVRGMPGYRADRTINPVGEQDYREYCLARSMDELMEDALAAHDAVWPALRAVIEARAAWGDPAVIEGWALLPDLVVDAPPGSVAAVWLLPPDELFEGRVERDRYFFAGFPGVTRKVAARSAAFAGKLRERLAATGRIGLELAPDAKVDATVQGVLEAIRDQPNARL